MSLTQTFQALSEPNRRKIIDLLKETEMAVSDIGSKLAITLPTLSHHLDVLKRAGLILSRRDGQKILYSINMSVLEDITEQIIKFLKN
jgi:DNA-binding transcriptional ArsR family regulator